MNHRREAAALGFLVALEVYWGAIRHDFPWHGTALSVAILTGIGGSFFLLVESGRWRRVGAAVMILGAALLHVGFDVHRLFFDDYPSASMFSHGSQVLRPAMWDPILAQLQAAHFVTLAVAVALTIWVATGDQTNRS